MYSIENNKLNEAMNSVASRIKVSNSQISDIYHYAKDEFQKLDKEMQFLQVEVGELIDRVDKLDKDYRVSKARLIFAQKNRDNFSEDEVFLMYAASENVLHQLGAEKSKEHKIIQSRHRLITRYNETLLLLTKSEESIRALNIAANLLSGNMDDICSSNDDKKESQIMGLRIIQAQEAERYRTARDLHDGPAQSLSMLMCKAEVCLKLIDKDVDCAKNELKKLKILIGNAIEDTRTLMFDLRPISICEIGLIGTLENYIDKIEYKNDFSIELRISNYKIREELIPHNISSSIFRMIQEALNNIQKHSKANQVIIEIMLNDSTLDIKIQDNGVGFNIKDVREDFKGNRGFGLAIMKERVDLLLGTIDIISDFNEGTKIFISLPFKSTFLTTEHI